MKPAQKILVLQLLLTLLTSCNSNTKELSNISTKTKHSYEIHDSINISKDKYFRFFNLNNIVNDSIYAFTYPNLELDLLNKKGELIASITEKGGGPGQLNEFIGISQCENKIFLLEYGNSYRCHVYDSKSLKFIRTIKLGEFDTGYYPIHIYSKFFVLRENNTYKLVFSNDSYKHTQFNPKYYQNGYLISEFIIDNDLNVLIHANHLKISETYPSTNQFISDDKRIWDNPVSNFKYYNNQFILYTNYTDELHIYDNEWKLKEKIKIGLNKDGFQTAFVDEENTLKRLQNEFKLRYLNNSIIDIDVIEDTAFLLFNKAEKEIETPKNMQQLQGFYPELELHVIDLKNKENNYIVDLPNKFSSFGKIKALKKNEIAITSGPNYNENIYLFTLKILNK
ncbi:MAG: 6-bladed beta-propeller [Tenacibaculum sp.]|nr:6-bladed beta-propeller [Tenacibaculum sp.]